MRTEWLRAEWLRPEQQAELPAQQEQQAKPARRA
jgi:hypothetical protein